MNTTLVNGFKTAVLLGLMIGVCLGVGYLFGREQGMLIGLIFGGGMSVMSYFFSDKLALAGAGARPVSREEAPELYAMVERLSQRAGLPMPRVYFSPEQAPNAFATGRNPAHGVVCVTAGLMNMMTPAELEGVIGHELSHIRHRDILIATVAAVMAGAITYAAHMMMWFGGGGSRDRDNPLGIVGVLLSIILAPIAAGLIQMAISRSREYAADASGAELAGGPEGLIAALKKLAMANERIPMNVNPATSSLYIVMPLAGESRGMMDLFRTHPPTEKRIAKLIEMIGQPGRHAA